MLVTFDCPDHVVAVLVDFAERLGALQVDATHPTDPELNEEEQVTLSAIGIADLEELAEYDVLYFWRAFTRGTSADLRIVDVARAMKRRGIRFRDADPQIFLEEELPGSSKLDPQVCRALRTANVPTAAFLRLLPEDDIPQIAHLGDTALESIRLFRRSQGDTE